MKDYVRCGLTEDGNVEACYRFDTSKRLVMDRRTRDVISSTVKEGTDDFRQLVQAARHTA